MINAAPYLRDTLDLTPLARTSPASVEWRIAAAPVPYPDALAAMDARAAAIADGRAAELIWLLEHPPLYTSGTSGKNGDLRDPRFPVFRDRARRTAHLSRSRPACGLCDARPQATPADVRAYVAGLEQWIIGALGQFGIVGERREDRVGVWVRRPDKGADCEDKIAAIGVRLRRWVSLHGIAINVAPDLSHFAGIVPCGVADPRYGVTSFADLGVSATIEDVDAALKRSFAEVFSS